MEGHASKMSGFWWVLILHLYGGVLKWGYPQISSIFVGFALTKTIQLWGYPHFWKAPSHPSNHQPSEPENISRLAATRWSRHGLQSVASRETMADTTLETISRKKFSSKNLGGWLQPTRSKLEDNWTSLTKHVLKNCCSSSKTSHFELKKWCFTDLEVWILLLCPCFFWVFVSNIVLKRKGFQISNRWSKFLLLEHQPFRSMASLQRPPWRSPKAIDVIWRRETDVDLLTRCFLGFLFY